MIAVLIYSQLGPYHIARLEAAGAAGKARGNTLVGIEVADIKRDYQWPSSSMPGKEFSRVTLFPNRDYWTLSYRRIRLALHEALARIRPDVVVLPGWGLKEGLAGLGWCLRRGTPRVVISDSHSTGRPLDPVWLKRPLVRRFHASFVGGKRHIRYLAHLGFPEDRCFVGCDVVDNEYFWRESRSYRLGSEKGEDHIALLSCLRLIRVKNIPRVLEILAREKSSWTWTIAGGGPRLTEIHQKVGRLGLNEKVRLLGHVDYDKMPRLYAEADFYIQPSLSDTWGLAVNEAMACARPVAVSRQCGCAEDLVQEDVNGFCFDATSEISLASALRRIWESKGRWHKMGEASREIIARWDLTLFASNFWDSCRAAMRPIPAGDGAPLVTKALSLAL